MTRRHTLHFRWAGTAWYANAHDSDPQSTSPPTSRAGNATRQIVHRFGPAVTMAPADDANKG